MVGHIHTSICTDMFATASRGSVVEYNLVPGRKVQAVKNPYKVVQMQGRHPPETKRNKKADNGPCQAAHTHERARARTQPNVCGVKEKERRKPKILGCRGQ